MKKIFSILHVACAIAAALFSLSSRAATNYGATLCHTAGYHCVTIARGQSFGTFTSNLQTQDLLARINRINIAPYPGMVVAIPDNLSTITIYDISPFPRYIDPPGTKTIYVAQKELAWGAYDADGNLVWWGPISPGQNYCSDIHHSCQTPNGIFYIQRKGGAKCASSQFPLRNPDGSKGGAAMPYCMHFWGGYALHGSHAVVGYAASHGCVRMFVPDAQWLNQHFISVPHKGSLGTRVIVEESIT